MFILHTNPPLTVRAIQKKIVPRLQPFATEAYMRKLVASGKVRAIPKNKGNGRTGWQFSILKEQTTTAPPSNKKPKRRKRRVANCPVCEIDGMKTKQGVAKMLGIPPRRVDRLLAATRRNNGIFPLPVGKKDVGRRIPYNVWKPEDIVAYKEITENNLYYREGVQNR
jgi:hypothetical protein